MAQLINFHRLGRIVILNDEIYLLSEKRYNQIFEVGRKIQSLIEVYDDKKYKEKHYKTCNKIRKFGKLLGNADYMLRDD